MSYTLEEKIKIIENSNALGEIPLDAMPFMQSDEYYFVSYSHRDYKKVYSDILRLQGEGLNIWYDRGLPAGKNWQDIADEAISKYACKGVIFYISENSLLSDAVEREILFVKGKQKDYLSINIPLNEGGQSESASVMLEKLGNKKKFSPRKKKIIEEAFGENVLFLDYNAKPELKAEKIRLLKTPPILEYQIKYDMLRGEKVAVVDNVLDLFAKEITVPSEVEFDGEYVKVKEIGECAFANCKYLKRVNFPKNRIMVMHKRAFYGCSSLAQIDVHNFSEIGDFAFSGCESLEKIKIATNTKLGNGVFGGTNLKVVERVEKTGERRLQSYCVNNPVTNRHRSTLVGYGSLKKYGYDYNEQILLYDTPNEDDALDIIQYNYKKNENSTNVQFENTDLTVFAIGDYAFANRDNIRRLSMIPSIRVIGESAFENCVNLSEFNYMVSNFLLQFRYNFGYNRTLALKERIDEKPLFIAERAFFACSSMERAFLPPYVSINEFAFANCFNLQNVSFESVKRFQCSYENCTKSYIGEYAFFRCISLSSIEIPVTVREIKQYAFGECKRLERVVLHAESNLNVIDKTAFSSCKKLVEISFNGTIDRFLQIEQVGIGEPLQQQFKIVCTDGVV